MRKACLLAFTMLLLSCGGDTPTEPKKDYYCSENYKTYETSDAYYFECPSMWCPYSNTYMTAFYFQDHCTKENLQRSSSSQVAPSSSSSSQRPSSSATCSPWYMCRCSDKYKFVLEDTKKAMNCDSGPCLVSIQKAAADAAECVLE